MRRIDFSFDDPRLLPDHLGDFYFIDTETGDDQEGVKVGFQHAWEAASRNGSMTFTMWPVQGDVYEVQASIGIQWASHQPGLWFSMPVESLPDVTDNVLDVERIQQRLTRWLDGVRALYDLCGPSSAQLSWERWGSEYIVGSIDKAIKFVDLRQLQMRQLDHLDQRVRELQVAHGHYLHIIDPFPIPCQGQWAVVTLGVESPH